MSPMVAESHPEDPDDVLAVYEAHVAGLPTKNMRFQRRQAARAFLSVHPDLDQWMTLPTVTRLRDLHRFEAWPMLTWCLLEGRLAADLELLVSKPPGCDLTAQWCLAFPDEVGAIEQAGIVLGWSDNWTRQRVSDPLCKCVAWLEARVGFEEVHDEHEE